MEGGCPGRGLHFACAPVIVSYVRPSSVLNLGQPSQTPWSISVGPPDEVKGLFPRVEKGRDCRPQKRSWERTSSRRLTLSTALMHINFQAPYTGELVESDVRPGLPSLVRAATEHRDASRACVSRCGALPTPLPRFPIIVGWSGERRRALGRPIHPYLPAGLDDLQIAHLFSLFLSTRHGVRTTSVVRRPMSVAYLGINLHREHVLGQPPFDNHTLTFRDSHAGARALTPPNITHSRTQS